MKINLKDVRVGGSAQTTAFLGTDFRISKDIRLGVDYSFREETMQTGLSAAATSC